MFWNIWLPVQCCHAHAHTPYSKIAAMCCRTPPTTPYTKHYPVPYPHLTHTQTSESIGIRLPILKIHVRSVFLIMQCARFGIHLTQLSMKFPRDVFLSVPKFGSCRQKNNCWWAWTTISLQHECTLWMTNASRRQCTHFDGVSLLRLVHTDRVVVVKPCHRHLVPTMWICSSEQSTRQQIATVVSSIPSIDIRTYRTPRSPYTCTRNADATHTCMINKRNTQHARKHTHIHISLFSFIT